MCKVKLVLDIAMLGFFFFLWYLVEYPRFVCACPGLRRYSFLFCLVEKPWGACGSTVEVQVQTNHFDADVRFLTFCIINTPV